VHGSQLALGLAIINQMMPAPFCQLWVTTIKSAWHPA